jgi:hypothetical protein
VAEDATGDKQEAEEDMEVEESAVVEEADEAAALATAAIVPAGHPSE